MLIKQFFFTLTTLFICFFYWNKFNNYFLKILNKRIFNNIYKKKCYLHFTSLFRYFLFIFLFIFIIFLKNILFNIITVSSSINYIVINSFNITRQYSFIFFGFLKIFYFFFSILLVERIGLLFFLKRTKHGSLIFANKKAHFVMNYFKVNVFILIFKKQIILRLH